MTPEYTTQQVAEATGATYRQVDYWTRRGWITAETPARGSGTRRAYSLATVVRVGVIVALMDRGFTLEAALGGTA